MWPVIADSTLIDISPNKAAAAYQRDFSRRAPYNYFVNGRKGLKAAPDATIERDIGFTFDTSPDPDGKVGLSARIEWPAASAEFRYDQASRLYLVELNDRPAQAEEHDDGQRAATVVIQYVEQNPSAFFDKGGGNTPHAETIGKGRAVVLRDGLRYDARWERTDADSGTLFTTADGDPLSFKPGQVWVALADETREATLFPAPRESDVHASIEGADGPLQGTTVRTPSSSYAYTAHWPKSPAIATPTSVGRSQAK
jgi:hypothetical protein